MSENDAILKVNGLKTYFYQASGVSKAVDGVSFSLRQGTTMGIVGESGSGKSTLMNIIGVLDRQTEGTYFLEGKDVNKMDDSMRSAIRNKRIGFVFQNFNLLPKANALKNVMVPLLYSTEKEKNQKEINLEARANFEKEMQKHKEYYRKFNIFTLIYTDSDLQNLDQIFEEMQQYLKPEHENRQILEATLEEFKRFSL